MIEKSVPISDENNYSRVYAVYFPKLVRFSQTYVQSQQDAENIVQDIFLYLWEHQEIIYSLRNMNAFLFTMVKNRCIDFLREQTQHQNKRHSLSDLQEKELQLKLYALQQFDENKFSEAEIEDIIQRAIDSLPEKCREIFVLSRMEGLQYKEIANQLKISINTVENQMAIALKKLRIKLKDNLPLFIFII